jgi:elongator complex protein 1
MCHWHVDTGNPIRQLMFCDDSNLLVLGADSSLSLIRSSSQDVLPRKLPLLAKSQMIHFIIGTSADSAFLCIFDISSSSSFLVEIDLATGVLKSQIALPKDISSGNLANIPIHANSRESLLIMDSEGTLLSFNLISKSFSIARQFSEVPEEIASVSWAGDQRYVSLNSKRELFIDSHLVSSRCSSFAIHPRFFVFVNVGPQYVMYLMDLQVRMEDLLESRNDDPHCIRYLEKGSRILSLVPSNEAVILQHPRGNLEAFHPRALVLVAIGELIRNKEFGKAFRLARTNRVDLNALCDHDITFFLDSLDVFVKHVADTEYLNLFISSLRCENTCLSKFQYYLRSSGPVTNSHQLTEIFKNKISIVCQKMRQALLPLADQFFLTILTTYVKEEPPQFEAALLEIRKHSSSSREKVNDALKYLIFLVDVDRLLDAALGMYDLDLVVKISRLSQKDPQEFLPFLNALQSERNIHLRRFKIDMHLKRFDKALRNIFEAGPHFREQCFKLIEDTSLHVIALELFPRETDPVSWNKIMRSYGSSLMRDAISEPLKAKEGAHVFQAAGAYEDALNAFIKSQDHSGAFLMAKKLGYSQEKLSELAVELVDVLRKASTARAAEDAAFLLVHYCQDVDEAVIVLLSQRCFQSAMDLCQRVDRMDIVETNIGPSVTEAFFETLKRLEKSKNRFHYCGDRLRTLRTELKTKYMQDDILPELDLVSEAASTLSMFTLESQVSIG